MDQLSELVQSLMDPRVYPDPTTDVRMVQTQMSVIFFTGKYVYKVKKPVNLGYLDYTSIEARRFFCHREIELNQRLCPDVYLDVMPIRRNPNGRISIVGGGDVIEYSVKMLYLPQDKMLSALLEKNQVSPDMLVKVAQKLAQFHKMAETIKTFGGPDIITKNTNENFEQTEKYIGNTITNDAYLRIKDYTEGFIALNESLFQKRKDEGKIKDCHGDLHAQHICFNNGICIYDCIEFNDRFRYCDVASEVAFLAMDLEHYGRNDLARAFVDAYLAASKDAEIPLLLNFYKCYFAYVRGKVESFKLDDAIIPAGEKEIISSVAKKYFDMAEGYLENK